MRRILVAVSVAVAGVFAAVSAWVAFPTADHQSLPPTLTAASSDVPTDAQSADAHALIRHFQPQRTRSFCGPASLATILGAYGVTVESQFDLLPTFGEKVKVFYSGLTLAQLARVAREANLSVEVVYAENSGFDELKALLVSNLQREGDFAIVNYDRRTLGQAGGGHHSPVAAYDADRDAFLILDEATFRYPFTWVPANQLYQAMLTLDGDRSRGLLVIKQYLSTT